MQPFDRPFVALASHRHERQLQPQRLALTHRFGNQEGFELRHGVVQDVGESVAGMDEAVDGVRPGGIGSRQA